VLWLVLAIAAILLPQAAQAFHDQGYSCYVCHTLKSGDVRPGSRAVLNLPGNVLPTIPTKPTATSLPLPGTGGYPISCDYCHRSNSDIPKSNMADKVGFGGTKHPVDLISTGDVTTNPREITCNDCHNGGTSDVVPTNLLTRGAGYPDHLNLTAGYTHNLTSNPPHLTQPYWGVTLPGVTRANDTNFWTGVRNNTQNMVCWVCHDGAQSSPFTNVTATANIRTEYTGLGNAKGHQVRTLVGGAMQPGSALPCYDCHDSHGSVNAGLVLDNQSIYGPSTSVLALTSYTGARPRNDLRVCAQCHDTGLSATAAGTRVEGLNPVDPYNSTDTATIHLSGGVADNMLSSTKNCLAVNSGCHATPHNPVGESVGGQNCAVCHVNIYNAMNAGTATGYHHVMLGDNAPIGGLYPVNPAPAAADSANRTCLICHVDHNYFSKTVSVANTRARNLRRDITVQPDNGANAPLRTDYDNTLARGGVCTSCHENAQTKSIPGTNIKNDGIGTTSLVSKSLYGGSAHNYPSIAPFIQGHFSSDNADPAAYFQANCSKCHNDTSQKDFQDNSAGLYPFGLHASDGAAAVDKLLAQMGAPSVTDNLGELFCYRCHSTTADAIGGTRKTTALKDWYGAGTMSATSERTWQSFQKVSRHPVAVADQAGGTRVVECGSCHNVHAARSASGSIAANPDNTYQSAPFSTVAEKSAFCLACHDGAQPVQQVDATRYVPATVKIPAADNVAMNKASNGARGHWSVAGSLQSSTVKDCETCHDKHGSTAPKLLGSYDVGVGYNQLLGFAIPPMVTATDNQAFCNLCHAIDGFTFTNPPTPASIATYESYRDNTGYFQPSPAVRPIVRWTSPAVFTGAYSPHNTTAKVGPASLGGRQIADCNGCHDPHGAPNQYDMLLDNMTSTNFKLCFDCHGLAGSPAGTDNIAQYYPAAAQGLGAAANDNVNTGHNIKTAGGLLARFSALPCYDCHVVHGSANNNTQLKSDERWANLGDTRSNAANNRTFCLGCHVASNDAATTGTVENLQRQTAGLNKLKLPTANPIDEHASTSTQSCAACHAGRNANDNTYSPHNPASGQCDLCHESQGAKSSAAATFNGAHARHTDNTTYRLACKQCHSWTATVAPATHKNDAAATQHAEVRFDNQAVAAWANIQYATATIFEYRSMYNNPYGASVSVPAYAAGSDNATVDARQSSVRWTGGTCSQVWCHSTGYSGDNVARNPQWIQNSLPSDCTGCHGNNAASANRMGTAGWGSPAHLAHITNGYECSSCHRGTVGAATSRAIAFYDNHVNGVPNVLSGDNAVFAYDNSTHTCSSVNCHSGNSANWFTDVGKLSCANCHIRANGDLDDFGNGSPATMSGNGLTAAIDNAEWLWSGHGRDTGTYDISLDNAANLLSGGGTSNNKCSFCHDSGIAHDNVANPFRLANGNWQGLGWNGNCYVCHSNISGKTATGYTPPADTTGNYGAKTAVNRVGDAHYNPGSTVNARHSSTYNGGKFCFDCHDPHGDRRSGSGNIFMVGSRVSMKTDNTLGLPVGGNDNSNRRVAAFVNNVNGSDYATGSGSFQGICETCHEGATGITHYYNTGAGTAHSTSKCTTCHIHDGGFKGLGGPDVGQYFDRKIQAPSASNYFDNSSHPLRGLTDNTAALLFGGSGSTNCLGCHYASGAGRTSDECLKCHYENNGGTAALGTNHIDKQIQLAVITPGTNTYGTAAFPIASITDYDNWCLQCHNAVSATSLGGVAITSKAVTPAAAFTNGRHRADSVGCIYCHQPHGRGNAKLVRENADNRRTAGGTPMRFGVFPNDNLNLGGYGAAQNQNFRARQYWADNSLPYLPEADDDQSYCNKTCHVAKASATYNKDKIIKRDGTTGNYLPNGGPTYRKVFVVGGVEYTIDNTTQYQHQHPNGEIIPTDSMVSAYAALSGLSGPTYFQYPLTTSSLPSAYNPATSDLPFSPDYLGDGVREFTNAYNGLGVRITYRLTCSTCHNPHGTTLANAPGDDGFPDLRLPRANPSTLCLRCHK
jgi:predicted CxxxxCH...CXXCH cytochrome family protein